VLGLASGILRSWPSWLPIVAVLTAAVLYGLWKDPGADRPSAEFHQIASQIIPVLLLAVVVEQSDRWRRRRSPWPAQVIVALLVGEIAAMIAVAFGEQASPHADYIVSSEQLTDVLSSLSIVALAAGFLGVIGIALGVTMRNDEQVDVDSWDSDSSR
jgi:4-hydroxybenzoate polyprenyltransferase